MIHRFRELEMCCSEVSSLTKTLLHLGGISRVCHKDGHFISVDMMSEGYKGVVGDGFEATTTHSASRGLFIPNET